AGIGKSRLAQELMGLAQQEGFSVLIGRCSEGEGAPPLWPWVGVLRALLGAVAVEALAPETQDDLAALSGLLHLRSTTVAAVPKGPDAPGEADAARFRTWDALARVLEAGSAQRPLLIALED